MKVTIRVDVTTDYGETETSEICQLERPYRELEPGKIGLSLADGKDVLHRLQRIVVAAQAEEVCMLRRFCARCHRFLDLKDRRIRKVDTVFGTIRFRSARIISCACVPPFHFEAPYGPMSEYVPERETPELLALQAKLSARMPYRQVVETMREFLPVSDTLNHVTVRNRALRAGARIDGDELTAGNVARPDAQWTLAIDGGFVRGRRNSDCSSFEVLTGRLATKGHAPRVFAFVRKELPDAVERLASLVRSATNNDRPTLSVITDGANGLHPIASKLPFAPKPVLDWFHISMRVRYLKQIVKGMRAMSEPENAAKRMLAARIDKLRWCFWHGNAAKVASRMREVLTICRLIVPQTPKFADSLAQLGYRARELVAYVKANGGSTINYGKRHREGEPISTAMAESAVNQILNKRMCKRQQMRWSPRGVHLLAQVRCAVINGDLHERLEMIRRRPKAIPIEVAVFLDEFRRASETLPQGF